VFEILRKLKLNVMGDIGCYTLGALPPLSAMDLCVCMGAGVNAAFGIQQVEKEDAKRKTVAVIGDSTFLHSGITGLLNIVYNNGNTVVIIMDNATTAMTGGQEHPASGKTLAGGSAPKVDFAALAKSLGVENVAVVDPYNLDETRKAIENALEVPGPAVVITRAPCVFLQDKSTFTTVAIDYGECSTCKLCLNIGCPGIEFDPDAGEKGTIIINENLCIGCSVCEQVCPRDAIGEVTGV
jgi:indolepyruvate ferredoxin oxidoreductase alpha subunit